jgi:3-hydroxyisobutyrate dehydrogenase-like beta-hydroxyacid dehydrogenase
MSVTTICLLGFGEVGQILGDDLSPGTDRALRAFDLLFADADSGPSRAAATRRAISPAPSASEAATGCDLVVSVVTASEALAAARSVAPSLTAGCYYLDLNSVSPQTRRDTRDVIETAGGRFVEGAVMSPIEPRRIESPILLGGPHATGFAGPAIELGFTGSRVYSDEIGAASAVKMCRSVIIKGVEALLAESLAAARHFGAEDEVLESLGNVLPLENWRDEGWRDKARYMIARSLQHGERRAGEMREVAATVAEAGLDPHMSSATAVRQQWAAQYSHAVAADLPEMLDALLGASEDETRDVAFDG